MRARAAAGLLAVVALLAAGCEHCCGGCRKPAKLFREHRELPDALKNEGPPPAVVPKNTGAPTGAYGGS